jgi:hypothetical protein
VKEKIFGIDKILELTGFSNWQIFLICEFENYFGVACKM